MPRLPLLKALLVHSFLPVTGVVRNEEKHCHDNSRSRDSYNTTDDEYY